VEVLQRKVEGGSMEVSPALPKGLTGNFERKVGLMIEHTACATEPGDGGTTLISPQSGGVENMRDLHYRFLDLARVLPLSVEVGKGLAELIRPGHADGLLEKVTALRRQMAFELGLVVPGIRFRESSSLQPHGYAFQVNGVEAAIGQVEPNAVLAIPAGERRLDIPGRETRDPIYGAPAQWISPTQRNVAVELGAGVYDVTSVLVIHLSEVVRSYSADLLGRQETRWLLDFVAADHPDLVASLSDLSLGEIRGVLQALLRERVPLCDIVTIFEALADVAPHSRTQLHLVEAARMALARRICRDHMASDGALHAITLAVPLEATLLEAVGRITTGNPQASLLDAQVAEHLLHAVGDALDASREDGRHAVLVVHPGIRLYLRRLLEPAFSTVAVLSWAEVMNGRPPRPRVQIMRTLQPAAQ